MNIVNAMIVDVTVGLDRQNKLCVAMGFKLMSRPLKKNFSLTTEGVEFITKLMNYLEVDNLVNFTGKVIRIINDAEGDPIGWGHPIEDKFLKFVEGIGVKEFTQQEFEEILKTT